MQLSSKEALKRLKQETAPATYMPDFDKDKCIEIIKKDLDRLETLEKENQELKERYKKRAELSNELCEALKKYEKVFDILIDKFKFELGVSVVKEKYCYSLEFLFNNQYFRITKEQYELLKEVFGYE